MASQSVMAEDLRPHARVWCLASRNLVKTEHVIFLWSHWIFTVFTEKCRLSREITRYSFSQLWENIKQKPKLETFRSGVFLRAGGVCRTTAHGRWLLQADRRERMGEACSPPPSPPFHAEPPGHRERSDVLAGWCFLSPCGIAYPFSLSRSLSIVNIKAS